MSKTNYKKTKKTTRKKHTNRKLVGGEGSGRTTRSTSLIVSPYVRPWYNSKGMAFESPMLSDLNETYGEVNVKSNKYNTLQHPGPPLPNYNTHPVIGKLTPEQRAIFNKLPTQENRNNYLKKVRNPETIFGGSKRQTKKHKKTNKTKTRKTKQHKTNKYIKKGGNISNNNVFYNSVNKIKTYLVKPVSANNIYENPDQALKEKELLDLRDSINQYLSKPAHTYETPKRENPYEEAITYEEPNKPTTQPPNPLYNIRPNNKTPNLSNESNA
jgi:hypothetical protein